nr:PREDICTED: major facilitator superfamily domain-containing protein 6 [Bemisia tabaci]
MVFRKVNKKLLPMKAHYFLFNTGTGPVVPFLPPLARQLGFSTAVIGFIYTILPIFGMIAKPTLGAIADRYHCQRSLFLLSMLIACIGFFSISFVPPIVIHTKVHLRCDGETIFDIRVDGHGGACEKEKFLEELKQRNFTLSCDMICASNNGSSFADQICKWGNTDYCLNDARTVNQVSFVAKPESSAKKSDLLGKTSQVASKRKDALYRVSKEFNNPEFFEFKAEVETYFVESVGDKMYFPIKRAFFALPGKYFHPYCSEKHTATCQLNCDDEWVEDMVAKVTADENGLNDKEVLKFYEFWVFLFLLVISWVCMAAVVSIGDAICFELLGDRPEDYGLQRVWGAIGWGLISLIAGPLVDLRSGSQHTKDYSPIFYLCAVLLLIDMLVSSRIKLSQSKLSSNILKDVGKLLRDVRVVVFLFWCIFIGMCAAFVWQFLFIFLEEMTNGMDCNAKAWMKTLEGLSMFIQCFGGELPVFFCSGWILRKLGHVNSMSLVLLAFGVRFLLYSLLSNPWYSLPIELLNGFTFGLLFPTMASYASIIAPPGTEASVQGLVGAVFEGVGVSCGSLIGGLLAGWYGGAALYRVAAIGCFLVCVLHVMIQKLIDTRYRRGTANKDVATNAIYTSPTEAIHMLENEAGDTIS